MPAMSSGATATTVTERSPASTATHIIWGRPEFDRRSDSNSQTWSSGILDGVQIQEESASGSRVADHTEVSGDTMSSERRSRNGGLSRPLQNASSPVGQVERVNSASQGMLIPKRPPQASGDHGAEVDSASDDEAGGERHTHPRAAAGHGQRGGGCFNQELHDAGRCAPCSYFKSKIGCKSGHACRFCHLQHAEAKRARPCKAKRDRCRGIAETLQGSVDQDEAERLKDLTEGTSLQSGYMRSLLASKEKKEQEKSGKRLPRGRRDWVRERMGEGALD